jgi:hypothetical protein
MELLHRMSHLAQRLEWFLPMGKAAFRYTEADPGSKITLTGRKVDVVAETTGASRVYRTLPRAVDDFSINFEFYATTTAGDGSGEAGAGIVVIGDGVDQMAWGTWGTNNGVGVALCTNSSNNPKLWPIKWVNGARGVGTFISLNLLTLYYCRIARSGLVLTLSVFSDAERTLHVDVSPQTLAVVDTKFDKLNIANNMTTYNKTRTYYVNNVQTPTNLIGEGGKRRLHLPTGTVIVEGR